MFTKWFRMEQNIVAKKEKNIVAERGSNSKGKKA